MTKYRLTQEQSSHEESMENRDEFQHLVLDATRKNKDKPLALIMKHRQITPQDLFCLYFNNGKYRIRRYSRSQCEYSVNGTELTSMRKNPIAFHLVMEILALRAQIESVGLDPVTYIPPINPHLKTNS